MTIRPPNRVLKNNNMEPKNYSEINLENEKKGGWLVPTMVTLLVVLIVVFAAALFIRFRNQQTLFVSPWPGYRPYDT